MMDIKRENRAKYDFKGKTVLVTGATKGIGRGVVLGFAAAGADICAAAREADELETLKREVSDLGVRCLVCPGDLSVVADCRRVAEYFLSEAEKVDILINNAGMSITEPLLELNFDHWDTILALNLRAPAVMGQVVGGAMVRRGEGNIVNMASNAGIGGIVEHASYCSSKFGLLGLTKVMALELGPLGVRVNAVAPTVVLTPMGTRVWGDPAKADPVKAKIPLHRFAYPEEITDTVMFLASGSSSMIHGETIVVDGGAHAGLY